MDNSTDISTTGFLDLNYLDKLARLETHIYSQLPHLSAKDKIVGSEKLHRLILSREKFIAGSTIDFGNPKIELAFTLLLRQFQLALSEVGIQDDLAERVVHVLSDSLVGFETTLNETLNGVSSQAQLAQAFSSLEDKFISSLRSSS